jgi:hypothetical protein
MIWPWGQRSRSDKGHYGMRHTTLWSSTHIPNIIDLSRKTKMLWPGQENTIKKTIIWPWGKRSLRYATHRLMVMHPHTKYHWPISKDKNFMTWTRKYYLKKQLFDLEVKGQGPMNVITVCDTALWSYTHIPTRESWSGDHRYPRIPNFLPETFKVSSKRKMAIIHDRPRH